MHDSTRLTEAQLEEIIRSGQENPDNEPEIMRALLRATLYAHVPADDNHPRIRLVQFHRPDDGRLVLPVFTTRSGANEANSLGRMRVVEMLGRDLFVATMGATIMVDPNQRDCVLYPEEISVLLRTGKMGFSVETTAEDLMREKIVTRPRKVPEKMISALRMLYANIGYVTKASIGLIRDGGAPKETSNLLIAVLTKGEHADRVHRATVAHIQPFLDGWRRDIHFIAVNDAEKSAELFARSMLIYWRYSDSQGS